MSNKYYIKTVEINYNGKDDLFDKFLESVIRNYISEDKLSPDEVETSADKSA